MFHLQAEVETRAAELTKRFGRAISGFDVFVELARHGGLDEREWTYVKRDGSHITVNLVVTAQRDLDQTLVGFQGIATDITVRKAQERQLAALNQHLAKLALSDSLTGLDNRRSILGRLEKLWNSQPINEPLSVIIIDIDHFKKINDCLGHHTGDNVLERVASVIKDSIRLVDFCGRYGGEEFLVVCPTTSLCAAARVAERIRLAVEQTLAGIQIKGDSGVTISLGVADRCEGSSTFSELIQLADQRLYRAKELGRNQYAAS
jgi:diguanylate cyclase (GGDEF)-like protein